MTAPMVLAGLLALNLFTMLGFRQDKERAIAGQRRIAEADLLGLALIGGSAGALLARRLFRHKIRKQPFSAWLFLIATMQLAGLTALAIF